MWHLPPLRLQVADAAEGITAYRNNVHITSTFVLEKPTASKKSTANSKPTANNKQEKEDLHTVRRREGKLKWCAIFSGFLGMHSVIHLALHFMSLHSVCQRVYFRLRVSLRRVHPM